MPAPYPPEKHMGVVRLRGMGMTVPSIAQELHVSPSFVKKVLTGQQKTGNDWQQARWTRDLKGPIPYEKLSPEAQQAWNDIAYFARRYFGALVMPWQMQATEKVVGMLDSDEKEYAVMNMPPGAGKSTFFTLILAAWLTVRNRGIRGMIVSNTQRNAELYTLALRRALEQPLPIRASDNDIRLGIAVDAESSIVKDFGLFKAPNADSGERWSAKAFQVMQYKDRPISEKETTWSAFGRGGQFLGNRLDVVICDDVYDKSALRTVEARQEFKNWFDANVETRLEPNGLLLLVGQRQHADDIYRYAIDKKDSLDEWGEEIEDTDEHKPMYQHVIFKAHYEENCRGDHGRDAKPHPEGCLLYPGRLKWRDLKKVQLNKPGVYAVEYQQEDMSLAEVLVDPLWIKGGTDPVTNIQYQGCYDNERGEWELPRGVSGFFGYATCDPSPTMYWSCQYWLYHPETEQRFLVAHHRRRMNAPDLLDYNTDTRVYSGLMEEWQANSVALGVPIQFWIIEANAAQRFMMQYDAMKKWFALRNTQQVPHQTGANKSDPLLGVWSMQGIYKMGKVRLPNRPGGETRINTEKLVKEVCGWPQGDTDDAVMSQWFGEWNLPNIYLPKLAQPITFHTPSWLRYSQPLRMVSGG
jgi:hypothetical protein